MPARNSGLALRTELLEENGAASPQFGPGTPERTMTAASPSKSSGAKNGEAKPRAKKAVAKPGQIGPRMMQKTSKLQPRKQGSPLKDPTPVKAPSAQRDVLPRGLTVIGGKSKLKVEGSVLASSSVSNGSAYGLRSTGDNRQARTGAGGG